MLFQVSHRSSQLLLDSFPSCLKLLIEFSGSLRRCAQIEAVSAEYEIQKPQNMAIDCRRTNINPDATSMLLVHILKVGELDHAFGFIYTSGKSTFHVIFSASMQ